MSPGLNRKAMPSPAENYPGNRHKRKPVLQSLGSARGIVPGPLPRRLHRTRAKVGPSTTAKQPSASSAGAKDNADAPRPMRDSTTQPIGWAMPLGHLLDARPDPSH